jgi:PKD repeat protein
LAWTWSGENLSDPPDVLREIQDLNTRGCSAFTDDPPVVALALQPASGAAPLAVTADASGSTDTDTTPIATYSFDWGDGTTTGPQPGPTATHTYASAGSYTVTATATDSGGLAATGSAPVAVLGNLIGNPGFETSTAGWNTILTGTTLARAAGGHSGGWSALLTNTGTSSTTLGLNDSPNWVTATRTGTTYTASVWVRSDSPGAVVKLKVREYTGSTAVGSTSASVSLTTAWQQVLLGYAPVAGGSSSLDFQLYLSSAPPGTSFRADDAAVVGG